MKTSYLIIIAILIIAAITNPDEQRHKELLLNKVKPEINSAWKDEKDLAKINLIDAVDLMLGSSFIDTFLGNMLIIDNYVFFSITKATWQKETKVIGIAAFGNLLLFSDLDKYKIRI